MLVPSFQADHIASPTESAFLTNAHLLEESRGTMKREEPRIRMVYIPRERPRPSVTVKEW